MIPSGSWMLTSQPLPDDIEALKAALLVARAEAAQAQEVAARAQAEAAEAKARVSADQALIARLKLQIQKSLALRPRLGTHGPTACACCGGLRLSKLGVVVTETLEVVPRSWKLIARVREKFSCRDCEAIGQVPAPFHVIAPGGAVCWR